MDKSFAKLIYKDKKGYNKCALAETLTFALVGIPNNRVTPKSWPLTPYALFRRPNCVKYNIVLTTMISFCHLPLCEDKIDVFLAHFFQLG